MNEDVLSRIPPIRLGNRLGWSETEGGLLLEDREANEKYGIVREDGRLWMFNQSQFPFNGKNILSYDLSDVASIEEGPVGMCVVKLWEGMTNLHKKASRRGEPQVPIMHQLNYANPDITTTEYVLYQQYPDIEDYLYYDEISGRLMVDQALFDPSMENPSNPFRKRCIPYEGENMSALIEIGKQLETHTQTIIGRNGTEKTIHFRVKPRLLANIIKRIAEKRWRNRFIETIQRVTWDGQERISGFLYNIGCYTLIKDPRDQAKYLSTVMKVILLSVIERNMEPDYPSIQAVPVVIGRQGCGKSTLCTKLALEWYGATAVPVEQTQKLIESAIDCVILELKEAIQFENGKAGELKKSVDDSNVKYRRPYDHFSDNTHIYFSMIATTNNMTLFKDSSGNRRFLPFYMDRGLAYRPIVDYTKDEILQLWAEALILYNKGERWDSELYEEDRKTYRKYIREAQFQASEPEMGGDEIRDYLDSQYPKNGDVVNTAQIREHLLESYPIKEVTSMLKLFGRHSFSYGFESLGKRKVKVEIPSQSIWGGPSYEWKTATIYKRVEPPEVQEVL